MILLAGKEGIFAQMMVVAVFNPPSIQKLSCVQASLSRTRGSLPSERIFPELIKVEVFIIIFTGKLPSEPLELLTVTGTSYCQAENAEQTGAEDIVAAILVLDNVVQPKAVAST